MTAGQVFRYVPDRQVSVTAGEGPGERSLLQAVSSQVIECFDCLRDSEIQAQEASALVVRIAQIKRAYPAVI